MNVKMQGLVGLPVTTVGDSTKLTWLVNMDFGGTIPSQLVIYLMTAYMTLPLEVELKMKRISRKEDGELEALRWQQEGGEEDLNQRLAVQSLKIEELEAEIERLRNGVNVLKK